MINGVGVDILEKERVFTIHKKYGKRFQERVLGDSDNKAIEAKSLNNQIRFISNNFACKEIGISEISSSNNVPLSAALKIPLLVLEAPVNEPFS